MRLTTIRRSSLEVFYKKRCSQRFRIIHKKTPEPEDNFLKTSFSKNTAGGFLCITSYVIHRHLKKHQYVIAQNANLLSIFREEADQFGWGEEDVLHLPKNFKSNYRAGILMVCCCFTVKCRFYDVYLSNLKIFQQNSVIPKETVTVLKSKFYRKFYLI